MQEPLSQVRIVLRTENVSGLLDNDGIWCQLARLQAVAFRGRPALFLDRDGVIVE